MITDGSTAAFNFGPPVLFFSLYLSALCISSNMQCVVQYEGYSAQEVRDALIREFGRLPPEQEALALRIQHECSVYRDIVYVNSPQSWGGTGAVGDVLYVRVLSDAKKHHVRLFTLYHEMGHITHRDLEYSSQHTMLGRKEGHEYKEEHEQIRRYRSLAKKVLSNKTILGSVMLKRIGRTDYLWHAPKHKMTRALTRVKRWYEAHADLFAYERLYQAQDFDTLCHMMYTFGLTAYDAAEGAEDNHPSDLERTLYLIGFLVTKGMAVEQLLLDYEARLLAQAKPQNALLYLSNLHAK